MRSHELARLLLAHRDIPVELCGEDMIAPLKEVALDTFYSEQGEVWVLEGDWETDE